jgi:hypothetical protein
MFSAILLLLVGQSEFSDQDMVIRFADHLYEAREYGAALQEYWRYSFLADSIPDVTRDHMIDCCIHTGQYTHAFAETDLLHDPGRIQYIKGYILYEAQCYDSSRVYFEQIGLPYAGHARTLIGLGYARQFKFSEAACYIDMPSVLPVYKKPVAGALFSLFPGRWSVLLCSGEPEQRARLLLSIKGRRSEIRALPERGDFLLCREYLWRHQCGP